MPFAIELFFDDSSDELIRDLWRRIAEAGFTSFLPENRNIPHVTLTVCEELDLARARLMIAELASTMAPMDQAFVSIGIFPYQYQTVFLGLRSSEPLLDVQKYCYAMLRECACKTWRFYSPEQWVPHCSLGMELTRQEAIAIAEIAQDLTFPIEFTIKGIGIVEFRPERIHFIAPFGG